MKSNVYSKNKIYFILTKKLPSQLSFRIDFASLLQIFLSRKARYSLYDNISFLLYKSYKMHNFLCILYLGYGFFS